MRAGPYLQAALKRDRAIVSASLSLVVVLAAAYTIAGVGMHMSALTMTRMAIQMPGMAMPPLVWSAAYAALVFVMWWVMMVAMMAPSAAPMVLVHAAILRKREASERPFAASALFLSGYLTVWALFSMAATASQWALESIGVVTGMMEIASPLLAGTVLIAAGLYQLTPLKAACLKHCQNPVLFIVHHWRPGGGGAFRMGLAHGAFCLGCCWFLMGLLFVGGIMNLVWIAGVAIFVGFEKFAAGRRWIPLASGAALTAAGLYWIARSALAA